MSVSDPDSGTQSRHAADDLAVIALYTENLIIRRDINRLLAPTVAAVAAN